MNTKKTLVLSLLLAVTLFLPRSGWSQLFPYTGAGQPKPGTRGPIISHAFAVEKGYYGDVWKIYIEAEDPDAKMISIASVVEEVGVGRFPTDWIYLKSKYQNHFKGYLQWNTFSSRTTYLQEWAQITLRVSVIDKAGNESNEVFFPFTFELTPEQYAYKPPAPFDEGNLPRLGYITVDLDNPGY